MKKLLTIAIILLTALNIKAQDRVFSRTYQSTVLPAGSLDLEYWATSRAGREQFYHRLDQRLEMEIGLGRNWQTAFYLNLSSTTQLNEDGTAFTTSFSPGVSNEWKWKMTDPVANALGSALYGEFTVKPREIEFEAKLILDKRMKNTLLAYNLVGELELEYELELEPGHEKPELEREKEYVVEQDFGLMQFLKPNLGVGFEVRNHNEIAHGEWEHSALFAGPSIHWSGKNWFINFNILPQLTNLKKAEGAGNLVLDEHEKVETRVLVAFTF